MAVLSRRRASRILTACLLALLVSACATPVPAPVGDRSQGPRRIPAEHRVRAGDTLYGIAWQYGLPVQRLAAWNRLAPPYRIYPGQRLRLRPPPAPRAAPSRPVVRSPAPPPSRSKSQARTPDPPPRKAPAAAPRWRWPADGPLLSRFDARRAGRKGIEIGGKTGDPVRAAADGEVVYAGSGLSGYGRLIIIRHNDTFLSAYAHNSALLAREGERVRAGEVIARMGRSGTDRTRLYFEIRRNSEPVDPLRYLPRR